MGDDCGEEDVHVRGHRLNTVNAVVQILETDEKLMSTTIVVFESTGNSSRSAVTFLSTPSGHRSNELRFLVSWG